MMKIISTTLVYSIWLPLCLLMVGAVMLWAILHTGFSYIIGMGWGLWLAILLFGFYILFPLFALHQTYTNPNNFNKFGEDFNLEKAQERIKQHQEEQKKYWKKHSKEHKVTTWKDRPKTH